MGLIDRDKLKPDYIVGATSTNVPCYRYYSKEQIDNAPTVDAEPVKHGYWIENDNGTYSCSECHSWIPNEQHYYARYCLYCGAKMDGEENEANAEC